MSNYPEPHEDVRGIDRTDTLLSLEDSNFTTRNLIRGFSQHLSEATLVGNPAPVVVRMNERLRNPQVGDLVVELSTIHRAGDHDSALKGLGILLLQRQEWACSKEDWRREYDCDDVEWERLLAEGEIERITDQAWYIQYGSAAIDVCRWTNCMFVTIPWPDLKFSIPAGRLDGTATVFTRESLLGSLADSGFQLKAKE